MKWCLLLLLVCIVCSSASAAVLLEEDFESGLGAWTVDNGVWAVGTPTVGPGAAYGGANCATTGLNGDFPVGVNSRLISPPISLPSSAPGQEIWLELYAWFSYKGYDDTWLQVQTQNWDGSWSGWSTVTGLGGPQNGYPHVSPWSRIGKDLTQYAGQTIKLGFYHGGDGPQGPDRGSYLDDLTVETVTPAYPFPQTFETGWNGWHSDAGVWQVGIATVGPPSAHAGTQCAGTFLNSNVPIWAAGQSKLVSPTFSLPTLEVGQSITLRAWEWWSLTAPSLQSGGYISVRDPGTGVWSDWTQLTWSVSHGTTTSGGWVENSADLTAYAGDAVRIGFELGWFTEGAGYYIDDVSLELPLQADFTGAPTTGVAPLIVDFSDASMGSPSTWLWDFGDGAPSNEQNPTHTFATPGRYTVSLEIGNGSETDTEIKERYVAVTFPDVPFTPSEYWALYQILACVDAGIVQGYWDGYHPEQSVTRDQMAVYISRALAGGDANVQVPTGVTEPSFADVPADHWAYRHVEYCKGLSIVAGYWDGYHPSDVVTRAQMAVYIARSVVDPTGEDGLVSYTPPATATFPDVATDYWAYKHIEYCKSQSIVSGYWDGYHPEEAVNRAQMAVYVQRAFGLPL